MKVAIIGAGVSGLSCACVLQKYGINPVIFEKKNYIGDVLDYTSISPYIFLNYHKNTLKIIRRLYGIDLTPLGFVDLMNMYSLNNHVSIKGNLGLRFSKGSDSYSITNQIFGQLNNPKIIFDSLVDFSVIEKKFDFVVVATGNLLIPYRFGIVHKAFNAMARCATVIGEFQPTTCHIWFNTNISKSSFSYLIPSSKNKASFVSIINNISPLEVDYFWKKCLQNIPHDFRVIETRDSQHMCGFVTPSIKNRIFFVGNAGGYTDSLIGAGALNALESGCLAARSIITGENFESLTYHLRSRMKQIHDIRKLINSFDNKRYDYFIKTIKYSGIKNLIYQAPFINASNFSTPAKLLRSWINPIS